jgi:hypothetical protein
MISLNPRLHLHRLDADFVVFHRDSGNTFLANGMAARIFAALVAGPIADDELARTICSGAAVGSEESPGSGQAVESTVEAMRVFDASLTFLKDLDAIVTGAAHEGPVRAAGALEPPGFSVA